MNCRCPTCGAVLNEPDIRFDADTGIVVHGPSFACLTKTETDLFLALDRNRSRTLSRERIMTLLYGGQIDEEPDMKIIDVLVCKIRRKLKGFPVLIENSWGRGYRLTHMRKEPVE